MMKLLAEPSCPVLCIDGDGVQGFLTIALDSQSLFQLSDQTSYLRLHPVPIYPMCEHQ